MNLGLNDTVVQGLAAKAGERFAYDAYRRFLDMFGNVVMNVPHANFEAKMEALKAEKGIEVDTDLTAEDLKALVQQYKQVYVDAGTMFPEDPYEQLKASVYAVFDSWESPRCKVYRTVNQLTGFRGTAVNVQTMAFGNMGDTSATGVLFTRNPATGENLLYGEYLVNAQGEDVVAGIRTPLQIEQMKQDMPDLYDQIVKNCEILEKHYKEMMVCIRAWSTAFDVIGELCGRILNLRFRKGSFFFCNAGRENEQVKRLCALLLSSSMKVCPSHTSLFSSHARDGA